MRTVATALTLILMAGATIWISVRQPTDRVWDVVIMGLPSSLTPKDIEVAPVGYLINQTHKPLFKRNGDGLYTSEVLSKWTQDRIGRTVQLCPRPELSIGKSMPFVPDKLRQFLLNRLPEIGLKANIVIQNDCLNIIFDRTGHDFFELFARYENAPSWKLDASPFESGLGEFYVSKFAPDKIELLRKSDPGSGYNKIIVHAYKDMAQLENLTRDGEIEDINRVSPDLVPNELKKSYADYGVVLLHTGVLIINVKDPDLRRTIYNCLDLQNFRKAFSPGQDYFKNVQTILPIGVPGAKEGLPSQKCINLNLRKKASVKFWNWKDNNRETLKAFWSEFNKTTGIEINYSDISLAKLMEVVKRHEKGYELLVVGLSATEFHYRDFYQYLVDPKHSILSNVNLDLSVNLKKLDEKPSESELVAGIKLIDETLARQGVVLPLFQQTRHFYFPKRIKGLSFGSNFLEHPIVAEIKN